MADEVKIVDVAGGPASEATLQLLIKAIEKMGGGAAGGGKGSKAGEKANKLFTDSTNRGTKANKKNTGAVNTGTKAVKGFASTLGSAAGGLVGVFASATASLVNMGMVFTTGANTIGDFVSTVPIIGGVLGSVSKYFQDGTDTFRQLSSQGAAFGNNIQDLRIAAASAAMPLDMFANMVQQNSTTLTLLGGTISEGAKRMGLLTKEMRGAGFLEMGMTMEELNEFTLGYIAITARRGRLEAAGSKAESEGVKAYITQLDKLSKLTGMSRKEMEQTMARQAQEANVNAMLSKLEGKAKENFTTNLAQAAELGPELENAFKDLADGVAQTDLGETLAALSPEFKKLAEDSAAGRVTSAEFQDRLKKIAPNLEKFRDDMGGAGSSALMGQAGFGELLSSLYKLTEYTNKAIDPKKLLEEQARRDKITKGFATFEQTIQTVKDKFQLALIESGVLDALATGLTEIASVFGVAGEEAAAGAEKASKDSTLTLAMKQFAIKITEITETIKTFIKDVANPEVSISQAIKNMFKSKDGEEGEGIDIGGMLGGAIAKAWEMVDLNIPWGALFVGGLAGIGAAIAAPVLAVPAGIAVAITAFFGAQALKNLVSGAWDLLVAGFTFGADVLSSLTSGIGGLFTSAWEKVKGWLSFGPDNTFSISALGTTAWATVTGWFGLTGLDFSISALGTLAWEAVKTWFSFGTEVAYSIGSLALTAWNTVTGWFGFGKGEAAYSIGTLATSAWTTVTGWFDFGGMEMPSIKSMFQTVIDKVKGFFTFDFKMPNFKSFLPKWMGGEGKTLSDAGDAAGTGVTTQMAVAQAPSVSMPTETGSALSNLATVSYATLNAELMNLKSNMDNIGKIDGFKTTIAGLKELDTSGVSKYNDSIKDLNDTFIDLNKTLSEDNKGLFGGGTGIASADVVKQGGSGLGGNNVNQLNTTMQAVLTELIAINTNTGTKMPNAIRESSSVHG